MRPGRIRPGEAASMRPGRIRPGEPPDGVSRPRPGRIRPGEPMKCPALPRFNEAGANPPRRGAGRSYRHHTTTLSAGPRSTIRTCFNEAGANPPRRVPEADPPCEAASMRPGRIRPGEGGSSVLSSPAACAVNGHRKYDTSGRGKWDTFRNAPRRDRSGAFREDLVGAHHRVPPCSERSAETAREAVGWMALESSRWRRIR